MSQNISTSIITALIDYNTADLSSIDSNTSNIISVLEEIKQIKEGQS